jgi:hypothetical protein
MQAQLWTRAGHIVAACDMTKEWPNRTKKFSAEGKYKKILAIFKKN